MPQAQIESARNQTIECARLIASFFVVFIHCPFPGNFGRAVSGVARMAVPLFFVISGYFAYGIGETKAAGRLQRVLRLNVTASLLYAGWRCLKAVYYWEPFPEYLWQVVPTGEEIVRWVLLNNNPYAGHLWYLAAAAVCWFVLWGYLRFFDDGQVRYQMLYSVCACLLAVLFATGELAMLLGVDVPYMLYRNATFLGLPMFGLGIFLGQYRQRLVERFALTVRRLVFVIFLASGFSLVCQFTVRSVDLPVSTIVAVAALMLLMVLHPNVLEKWDCWKRATLKFGTLSTDIYIWHLLVIEAYNIFGQAWFAGIFGKWEDNLRPILVLGITLAVAIALEGLRRTVRWVSARLE